MIEKPQSERDAENGNNKDRPFGYLNGVVIAGVWVFIVLLMVSLFWPNLTERTKFFTSNLFNVLIAFTVIAQVVINRKQWQAMEDSLVETRKLFAVGEYQAEIAGLGVKVSERSAQAAEHSIELNQQNTITTQRAYVSVTERLSYQDGFILKIENTGSTPALEVVVWFVGVQGYSRPELPENDPDCFISIGLLAPRSSYEVDVKIRDDLSENKNEILGMEDFNYWCAGKIWYRDIFQSPDTDGHKTGFCFYQVPAKKPIHAWYEGNDAT